MEAYYTKIIESIVVIALYVLIRLVVNKLIHRRITDKLVQKSRTKIIRKTTNFIILAICLIILLVIWGVKHSELAVFVGSVLTVVGVAMFAQWSILSNITSSIIIFFNHSVKIGDDIAIMETKDYEIQGEVMDIGLFFVRLKMSETGEEITLPNNIFIQKTIKKRTDKM
ncbi:mechanosensitive ion channel domain-containing protein [uncultured Eudoraea sp.]|uniref:mechanosensitive ion channel domain-containing protein n=1 Tax=uncultured Eudoraea sp. TaxID=1035614 RepID=UPI002622C9F5|nr:mechanosensitive ion channel domain-containing protein [uncultured Eudoraea sp.]